MAINWLEVIDKQWSKIPVAVYLIVEIIRTIKGKDQLFIQLIRELGVLLGQFTKEFSEPERSAKINAVCCLGLLIILVVFGVLLLTSVFSSPDKFLLYVGCAAFFGGLLLVSSTLCIILLNAYR